MADHTHRPGDRVEITAVQSYEITWDDSADILIGLTGILVAVNERGIRENEETGRLDSAPFEVRIDRDADFQAGQVVFVAGVRRCDSGTPQPVSADETHLGQDPSHGGLTLHRGRREDCTGPDCTTDPEPVPLRWGLNDVMWGDDDTTTVMLSGPEGEPYWLELDPERASALRALLAGPDGQAA